MADFRVEVRQQLQQRQLQQQEQQQQQQQQQEFFEQPPAPEQVGEDFRNKLGLIFGRAQTSRRVRMAGIIFGQAQAPLMISEFIPRLGFWNMRSGQAIDYLVAGHYAEERRFDDKVLLASIQWMERETRWRYSGETDLVLFNVTQHGDSVELDFSTAVSITFERAIEDKAIPSAAAFMENLFSFAESYAGDDPSWGFSDQQGFNIGKSALWSVLVSLLPEAIRPQATRAKAFYVKDLQRTPA